MKKLQFIKKAVSGILCVGMLLESGTENLVYAAVINGEESVSVENSDSTTAVQQELPSGRLFSCFHFWLRQNRSVLMDLISETKKRSG